MVRIERKDTEKAKVAIASLAAEKAKNSGTCNTPEVNEALAETFHKKCYICENREVGSWEIEHLQPHLGNKDLKFDWNNLFWACRHCNNTKSDTYTPILDCTKVDVDDFIAFRLKIHLDPDSLIFEPVEHSCATENTCRLLDDVHYGHTVQKKMEAKMIRKRIVRALFELEQYIRDYRDTSGELKKDIAAKIMLELKNTSEFAAFKRWYIRDHLDLCAVFIECWKKDVSE